MSAKMAQAHEEVGQALQNLSVSDEQYQPLQNQYFNLKAAVLARDEDFQDISLPGDQLNCSSGNARVLDDILVADPRNPHITHYVSVDHVVEGDGSVQIEVNAKSLDEL